MELREVQTSNVEYAWRGEGLNNEGMAKAKAVMDGRWDGAGRGHARCHRSVGQKVHEGGRAG